MIDIERGIMNIKLIQKLNAFIVAHETVLEEWNKPIIKAELKDLLDTSSRKDLKEIAEVIIHRYEEFPFTRFYRVTMDRVIKSYLKDGSIPVEGRYAWA